MPVSDDQHRELMRRLHVPLAVSGGAAPRSSPAACPDGELPGMRATMDDLRRGGESEATIRRVIRDYDRSVRSGAEPPPVRRD